MYFSRRCCRHIPVDERVSHGGCDGAGLRFTQSEDALDDRQLSARGVQPTEGTPVVHHHTSSDHLTPTIHRSSLQRENSYHWVLSITPDTTEPASVQTNQ